MANPYYVADQGIGASLFGGVQQGMGLVAQHRKMQQDRAMQEQAQAANAQSQKMNALKLKEADFGASNSLGATDASLGLPTAGLPMQNGQQGPSAPVAVPNSIALPWMQKRQSDEADFRQRSELAGMAQGGINRKDRLNETAVRNLSEARVIPGQLDELALIVKKQSDLFGPAVGRFRSMNPWDEESRIANSKIKAVAQTIGKYMEGGVLRAEDIPKYAAMLPAVSDTPGVAMGKIDNVREIMQQKYNTDLESYRMSGHDTGGLPVFPAMNTQKTNEYDADDFEAAKMVKSNPGLYSPAEVAEADQILRNR